MVYCCVPYCRSSSRNKEGVSFHQFPSNSDLFKQWLQVISRDNFTINDKSPSSVVCSKHFKQEDFIPGLKLRKLVSNAVPSIFENYPSYKIPALKSRRQLIRNDADAEINNRKRPHSVETKCNNKRQKLVKDKNSVTEIQETSINDILDHEAEKSSEDKSGKISSSTAIKPNFYGDIINKNRRDIRLLRSKLWKKENQLNKLKNELESVQQKLKYYESNIHHSSLEKIIILQDEEHNKANFILQQIENFFVKRPTWNDKVIRDCILLNSCSPKGYNFIRQKKLLTLPSSMTLKRYIGPFTGEYGITSLIRDRLKEESSNLNDYEKFCSLVIDEMAIQQNLTYDMKCDTFFGLKTNNENEENRNQGPPQLANKLLCFLINGLSTSYRIPCGYYFPKQLIGKDLFRLTNEVLTEVEKCGFVIIRIVADNHKVNTAMFRMFGNGKLQHKIKHPNDDSRFLFLSFDQNHIIKNLRSQFIEKEMSDGQEKISGKYVKLLYDIQKDTNINIKAVRNLTRRHVEPTNIDKMNVGRAVLIFSPPVTAALEFLCQNSTRHPKAFQFKDAHATITYMKNIYKWFSIHDVSNRQQHATSRNENKKHFFSLDDERLSWLENDFLQYISSLKQASSENKLQFLSKETYEALEFTTKSTVDCIKYLLECGYHYVLTRTFNSDNIESLFSCLRQMNGGNDVLDVRSTLLSIEKILKTGTMITSKHSNVGRSDGIIFSKKPEFSKKEILPVEKNVSVPKETLEILDRLLIEQGKLILFIFFEIV